MGFHTGAYATCWDVKPISDSVTQVRISISRKNKQTGAYERDFGGFVRFCGTVAAQKAALLKERDRIKLGDVDVSNRYDKETQTTYTNYACFGFELQDDSDTTIPKNNSKSEFSVVVDDMEISEDELPF